ncbi:hypothetical protein PSPO01_10955 [Paraphaeosphaeria sporulosa]
MSCIVDWTNTTSQANHDKCPICPKRSFIKEELQPSSSGTDRLNRARYNSRHHIVEPRNGYRGNPRYAARAEMISENVELSCPGEREGGGGGGGGCFIEISMSRHASRCKILAPAWELNTPRIDPRSFDASSQQRAPRHENVHPSRACNVPQCNAGRTQPPPSRICNVSQENRGYGLPAPPVYHTTAPSTRDIVYVDARRKLSLISRSQGPSPPLEEYERYRAGGNTRSGSSTEDIWTASDEMRVLGPEWYQALSLGFCMDTVLCACACSILVPEWMQVYCALINPRRGNHG